jgi:hypothetical protein
LKLHNIKVLIRKKHELKVRSELLGEPLAIKTTTALFPDIKIQIFIMAGVVFFRRSFSFVVLEAGWSLTYSAGF